MSRRHFRLSQRGEGMITEFIPKGGMCAICAHKRRDCSGLPFETYPELKQGYVEYRDSKDRFISEKYITVRCLEWVRQAKRNLTDEEDAALASALKDSANKVVKE